MHRLVIPAIATIGGADALRLQLRLTGTPEQFKAGLRRYGLEFLTRPLKPGETLTWK